MRFETQSKGIAMRCPTLIQKDNKMMRITVPAALLATPALADPAGYGHMMDWGYGFGLMFGPVLWLIVLGLIVAGVIWLVRRSDQVQGLQGQNRYGHNTHGSAEVLATLNMRLAKGEIDEKEYLARKKLIAGENQG
jgi:putative membrane protein